MLKSLRHRISLTFIGLSMVTYCFLAYLGLLIVSTETNAALDAKLHVVMSEIDRAIDVEDDVPRFKDWLRLVRIEPPRNLATLQLFDKYGELLEHYGPSGIETLSKVNGEVNDGEHNVRICTTSLDHNGRPVGWLQVQLSTRERDQYMTTMYAGTVVIGLVFLGVLTVVSRFVSHRLMEPVYNSMQILRSFVADASHELNTPISILQARIESLERKLDRMGVGKEDLGAIDKALHRLDKVVSDLLLLSEVEDPLSAMKLSPVNISSVVEPEIKKAEERFAEKGIALSANYSPTALVSGNRDALSRVIANLVENAFRYTEPGGMVNIDITDDKNFVQVRVVDSGIGIPLDMTERVFERFFRVDKSRSSASGGTGLGLAICKAIVEAHRGTIFVTSDLGVGSTFVITMPKCQPRAAFSIAGPDKAV